MGLQKRFDQNWTRFKKNQFPISKRILNYQTKNLDEKIIKLASRLQYVKNQEGLYKSLIIDNFNENMYSASCLDLILRESNNEVVKIDDETDKILSYGTHFEYKDHKEKKVSNSLFLFVETK